MTRTELLQALADSRAKLEAAFNGLSEVQLLQPGASGEGAQPGSWAVRDVLAHCAAWEAEVVTSLAKLRRGSKPGKTEYSDAEIQAFNQKVYQANRKRPLENVLADFRGVRQQLLRQLEGLSEAELNAPRPWLGNHNLAQWVTEWIVNHETEHAAQLAEWRKGLHP
jgi:hypothetical protein